MSNQLFQNKYRNESIRLKNWDYGWNAPYFITICTQDRTHFFGEVSNGRMQLSEIGNIAQRYWNEIPDHFPFVILGEFVVMPNHVHGIIIIDKPIDDDDDDVGTRLIASLHHHHHHHPAPNKQPGGITGNKNPMLHDNLSRVVRWYKGRTTFESRKIHADFQWQSRFYDHIIRNEQSHKRISEYIINNPSAWKEDRFASE